MKWNNHALIIPSSVHVNAPYTKIADPAQREGQYLDSIAFFIRESPLLKIIACDNSGFVYPASLHTLAAANNKEIELLSFQGDNRLAECYGKGYGEGEIMEYVLSNSRLLNQVDAFIKVTGRLKVINIAAILRRSDPSTNYFMPVSLLRPRFLVPRAARPCVDIRIYAVDKIFFRDVLLTAYKEVRERDVYFLEHAYYKAILHPAVLHSTVRIRCFSPAPEFSGMSGSNGWTYKERSFLRKILIRLAYLAGYIRPV